MALKTKPSQITAEDHRLVRQFIKDSKAAGYDPTLTTIVLNKVRSDKSGKTAKKVANLQRQKPQGKPQVDPNRDAKRAEARRQAAQAGRESKAIKGEGGYLTGEEWAKMAGKMLLTVAGGAGVNLAVKGAGAAIKGGQALLTAAPKLLRGTPKQLARRAAMRVWPKHLKRLPKKGHTPKPGPEILKEKAGWVARQQAAKKAAASLAAKKGQAALKAEVAKGVTGARAKAILKILGKAVPSKMKAADAIAAVKKFFR